MLTLAQSREGRADRLHLAAAHIESAITHINNVRQQQVPPEFGRIGEDTADLRLLVTALADVRAALQQEMKRAGATEGGGDRPPSSIA